MALLVIRQIRAKLLLRKSANRSSLFPGSGAALYRQLSACLATRWCHHTPLSYLSQHTRWFHQSGESETDMELKQVVQKLKQFAPTSLAGSWDNVGMLVEPSPPHTVSTLLLTNDLTEDVMTEALEKKANMVLSYHPPIFSGMKRLTQATWKERIIVKCLENRVAVYSPHTTYDAIPGGVNDWLISPFGGTVKVLETSTAECYATAGGYQLQVTEPQTVQGCVEKELGSIPGLIIVDKREVADGARFHINCTKTGLSKAVKVLDQFPDARSTMEIIELCKPPIPDHGPGRICTLASTVTLQQAVDLVKKHLQLTHVRLAPAVGTQMDSPLKTVAVCAGSGSSVLRGIKADLYVTGEMSHHEVLDANHRGSSVILCEHSNTERGFLVSLKDKLDAVFGGSIQLCISQRDKDPLSVI